VTLKVRPLPEKFALQGLEIDPAQFSSLGDSLHRGRVRPTLQTLQIQPGEKWTFFVGFEESAQAVDWQLNHLRQECQVLIQSWPSILEGDTAYQRLQQLTDAQLRQDAISFHAGVPGSQLDKFLQTAAPLASSLHAHTTCGIALGHFPTGSSLDTIQEAVTRLRQSASALGGHVTLSGCPAPWLESLQPFGPPRPDWPMMNRIKLALDPKRIFQPGRFPPVE
jgi:FAD/FMN-containing dehydrogenase